MAQAPAESSLPIRYQIGVRCHEVDCQGQGLCDCVKPQVWKRWEKIRALLLEYRASGETDLILKMSNEIKRLKKSQ